MYQRDKNPNLTEQQKINRVNWFLNNNKEMVEYIVGTKVDAPKSKRKNSFNNLTPTI